MEINQMPQVGVKFSVEDRPARKLILKRGLTARDYFAYCEEVGCDVWEELTAIDGRLYEPAGFWLPDNLIRPGTSKYVQGVEVPLDHSGQVPVGYESIDLPACKVMIFQSQPYQDEDYQKIIAGVWRFIEEFDPSVHGYRFALDAAPRLQYEPLGERGYIEAWPVEAL